MEEDIGYLLAGGVDNQPMIQSDTFFVKSGQTLNLELVSNKKDKNRDMFDDSKYTVVWYQIRQILKQYSNLWSGNDPEAGNVHLEPIDYEIVVLDTVKSQTSVCVTEIIGNKGFGTYYFSAEILPNDNILKIKSGRFSTTELIHKKRPKQFVQISYRPDDSYLGYLCELLNTPFVIAPMSSTDGLHQTDCRCGSDCAAFAIYGRRRLGYPIPYVGPKGINRYLNIIIDGDFLPFPYHQTEAYFSRDGKMVTIGVNGINPGDIVHFGEQVSVFYEDRGIIGTLDRDDLLFQSFRSTPHVTSMAVSGFYHKPIRLFRWKQ